MMSRFAPKRAVPPVAAFWLAACAWSVAAQTTIRTPSSPKAVESPKAAAPTVAEVVVTASRADLLGAAMTASQGSVTKAEIDLRPVFRIGQIFESLPGLVVTVHSGEGKANQYLLRGFNLDHGTDFASFVGDMPVNRPTNAHGQGYSDQNFLMPQIVNAVDFTKGPYYAAIGDFGAVGSAHVRLVDDLQDQIQGSIGTLRDEDLFAGATHHFDEQDRLWGAFDVGHIDGPWSPPGDFNKVNATARFSHGTPADGFSLTGMYYRGQGRLETDQSVYALAEGLIGRYGTLDPTDGSRSERFSLSGHYGAQGEHWRVSTDVYAVRSTMTLWNDFTHYLFDPVNGDQEQQDETRSTAGVDTAFTWIQALGSIGTETTLGVQDRYDRIYIDRRHTRGRIALTYCELANAEGTAATPYAAVRGACSADRVALNDLGVYAQNTTRWTPWLRTVVGLREEDYRASDHSLTTSFKGTGAQDLFQPKGSLILGPLGKTELYVSAGRGFHSEDARDVFQTVPYEGVVSPGFRATLLEPTSGEEIGLRTNLIPKVQAQVAVFQEDFTSEQTYDADQGEDQASAPSRRQGVEISGAYRPFPWIEINTDLAFARARYHASAAELASFGLAGPFIANAPSFIGSFGVLVDNLGPWFGGLQWRNLGPYPVSEGNRFPEDKGYSEFNLDIGYRFARALKAQVGVYNLFDRRADSAAYYYTSRLTPTGGEVTGLQVHPLEPRSARLTLTATF
jgi:outer membrane receptor protein involved in Fe transport